MRKLMLSLAIMGCCSTGMAADYSWATQEAADKRFQQLSEEDKRRIMDDAMKMRQLAETAGTTPEGKRAQDWAKKSKRRMDQLASESAESDRKKMRAAVGLAEDEPSGLFYLLSWSMPIEMLRAYVLEAHWGGGQVVFRGVPPDKSLVEHVTKDYVQLSRQGVGLDAPVTMDPRMFDMFAVDAVPAIVLVDNMGELECVSMAPTPVRGNAKATIRKCEAPATSWWKVTGGVTTIYALERMADAGSKAAALRKEKFIAAASGKPQARTGADGTSLQPYAGKWEQAVTESDLIDRKKQAAAQK